MNAPSPAPFCLPEATIDTSVVLLHAAATATVSRADHMSVAQFTQATHVPDYTVETLENGNRLVKGLKIFRSGTFKDSRGDQHTWTAEHLTQMVGNFDQLRANGNFVDVPVREDHSGSINSVVGYFRSISTDGAFLYADLEFTEPDAYAKFERGTFRARSSEIGFYETNDEALFWPVVMGLAFVDVGAVEGLYSKATDNKYTLLTDDKESHVDEETFLAACNYAQALIDLELTDMVTRSDHEAAVTAATAAAVAEHAAGAPVAFRIAGQPSTDHAAVQVHITALETAQDEARSTARRDFVAACVAANKLPATQLEVMQTLAVNMNDADFAAFKGSYEAAPVIPLFANHGGGVTNPAGEAATLDDDIAVKRETLAMHRRSGMTEDQIKQTQSFKDLETLEAQKSGNAA